MVNQEKNSVDAKSLKVKDFKLLALMQEEE